MAKKTLPDVVFETGVCVLRRTPNGREHSRKRVWMVIGRLDTGVPFLLEYRTGGITGWSCAERIGDSLRKKILGRFRETLRRAEVMPTYISQHDFQELDLADYHAGALKAEKVFSEFFRKVWRDKYLDDRDEDYVGLSVPYADKESVKALGAKWDGQNRVWRVERQPDMSAFQKWLSAA